MINKGGKGWWKRSGHVFLPAFLFTDSLFPNSMRQNFFISKYHQLPSKSCDLPEKLSTKQKIPRVAGQQMVEKLVPKLAWIENFSTKAITTIYSHFQKHYCCCCCCRTGLGRLGWWRGAWQAHLLLYLPLSLFLFRTGQDGQDGRGAGRWMGMLVVSMAICWWAGRHVLPTMSVTWHDALFLPLPLSHHHLHMPGSMHVQLATTAFGDEQWPSYPPSCTYLLPTTPFYLSFLHAFSHYFCPTLPVPCLNKHALLAAWPVCAHKTTLFMHMPPASSALACTSYM